MKSETAESLQGAEWIFLAESPPPEGHFNQPGPWKPKTLSWYLSRALYRTKFPDKTTFLARFREDRCRLVDAANVSLKDKSRGEKRGIIRTSLPSLIHRLNAIASSESKLVIVSDLVYEECLERLRGEGFSVVNKGPIPQPFSSKENERNFAKGMKSVLAGHGWDFP